MMIFDIIAYRVFLFSKFIHKTIFGKGDYINDAKIQTLFIVSLIQTIYIVFILVDYLLNVYFNITTPKYLTLVVGFMFLIFNYLRYYRTKRLNVGNGHSYLILNNNLLTDTFVLLIFVIGFFLFIYVGNEG